VGELDSVGRFVIPAGGVSVTASVEGEVAVSVGSVVNDGLGVGVSVSIIGVKVSVGVSVIGGG
jgi:hypothetical protein